VGGGRKKNPPRPANTGNDPRVKQGKWKVLKGGGGRDSTGAVRGTRGGTNQGERPRGVRQVKKNHAAPRRHHIGPKEEGEGPKYLGKQPS